MQGKIVKGIAGFYYVDVVESGIYECKAKGIFRKEKKKPLVGDDVEITVLDEASMEGNLIQILPRKNQLIRPAVANVDQAVIIFAMEDPAPNYQLLDRFLVNMQWHNIPAAICFNKTDLGQTEQMEYLQSVYQKAGYQVLFVSGKEGQGVASLHQLLKGKTSVVAGPSGVGKSTLTNILQEEVHMETGEISRKLGRGKHTTRHAQLINIEQSTYLVDTPGFTSFDLEESLTKEDLRSCFPELAPYEGQCRFQGCSHTHEPGCAVKSALEEGQISSMRYENYTTFYAELIEREKRRY